MSIGEALAQARRQAGLTLTEVSQRTRIRETIIAGIEADDYSACGGDFYARGHIRAIARVAGIASEPLIEEYDAARRPPDEPDEFQAPPTSGRRGRRGLGGGHGGGGLGHGGAPGGGGGGLGGGGPGGGGGGPGGGGGAAYSDGTGLSDSAVRGRGSGRGGWLGRGGRDRWEDEGRAGHSGLDQPGEPGPAPQTERWPGLGWLGRGYRTDSDGWDEQPGHGGPDLAEESEPATRADWNDPDDWDQQPAHGGPQPTDELESATRADWNDPDRWDEQPGSGEPWPADEAEPASGTDWSDADRWDDSEPPGQGGPDVADEPGGRAEWSEPDRPDDAGQPGHGQPEQADEAEPGDAAEWSEPDWWDDAEVLEHDGPDQADEPQPARGAGRGEPDRGEPDRGDPDGWDGLVGGRPRRAGEPARLGWLGAWLGLGDPESRRLGRGQLATVWVVLAAVIGFAIYSFVFAAGHRASATGSHRSHSRVQAAARRHAGHGTRSPSASPTPTTTPAVALKPASAAAFGVTGQGQGDNASQAGLAIDHNPATAWHTDWYASAHFGNLYQGTGLLIDMGHPVTITAAQIALGRVHGASLALRIGNTPTLGGLRTAAAATGAGGTVSLKPATPVQGRYVLVWLTGLPRDNAGTYQASIYNIKIDGQP